MMLTFVKVVTCLIGFDCVVKIINLGLRAPNRSTPLTIALDAILGIGVVVWGVALWLRG